MLTTLNRKRVGAPPIGMSITIREKLPRSIGKTLSQSLVLFQTTTSLQEDQSWKLKLKLTQRKKKVNKDSLGDRMKNFEDAYRLHLPGRLPIILRVDGCHFHTYTKGCKRPFDENLVSVMNETAKALCDNIQGAKIAYVQSDEISILINAYESLNSESWFLNNLQKMVSVSAGIASATFTQLSDKIFGKTKLATFDSRAFLLPKEEVNNYFFWRQQDCSRNSIQMLARSLYSQNECFKKNSGQLREMCIQKNTPWEDMPTSQRLGRCIFKNKRSEIFVNKKTLIEAPVIRSFWDVDLNIPNFHEDQNYIQKYV